MRVIDNIPHPSMRISIFQMNEKYLVKFEAGPMEQTYKFNQEEVAGIEGLKKRIDVDFQAEVLNNFSNMYRLLSGQSEK